MLTRIYELIVVVQLHMVHYTVFTVFRLLTDFVCLYTYMSFDFPFVRLFGVR